MTHSHRLLLKWARTLHVYLTLFGFMLLLFFAVTGFMLNHEDWFLPGQTTTGKLPTELLAGPDRDAIVERLRDDFGVPRDVKETSFEVADQNLRLVFTSEDGAWEVDIERGDGRTVVTNRTSKQSRERISIVAGKMPMELLVPDDASKQLPIVEKLRKDFGARGEVVGEPKYEKESESFSVDFRSPGYLGTATIRAGDGQTVVTHRTRGFNGVILDLHRGKDSGLPWSFVIDAVSVLFVVVSATGLILWSSLRSRAQLGLVVMMAGLAIGLAVYLVWVPR